MSGMETVLVDELPTNLEVGAVVTRRSKGEVVFRQQDQLWVAQELDVLDAKVIR